MYIFLPKATTPDITRRELVASRCRLLQLKQDVSSIDAVLELVYNSELMSSINDIRLADEILANSHLASDDNDNHKSSSLSQASAADLEQLFPQYDVGATSVLDSKPNFRLMVDAIDESMGKRSGVNSSGKAMNQQLFACQDSHLNSNRGGNRMLPPELPKVSSATLSAQPKISCSQVKQNSLTKMNPPKQPLTQLSGPGYMPQGSHPHYRITRPRDVKSHIKNIVPPRRLHYAAPKLAPSNSVFHPLDPKIQNPQLVSTTSYAGDHLHSRKEHWRNSLSFRSTGTELEPMKILSAAQPPSGCSYSGGWPYSQRSLQATCDESLTHQPLIVTKDRTKRVPSVPQSVQNYNSLEDHSVAHPESFRSLDMSK